MFGKSESQSQRDPILRKLRGICRRAALWTMGWGYLLVLLGAIVLLFAGVLLDHALVLQSWSRLAFFRIFVAACCGGAAVALLFPLLRHVNPLYVARRIEERRPELRNALISYVQCRADARTPGELKRMMGQRAAAAVRDADTSVAVDRGGLARLAGAVGFVILAFLAYGAFSPKSAAVSLKRLIMPRADIHPPTATRIVDVRPGELYALKGSAPELAATVEGAEPESVYAVWEGGEEGARRLILTRDEDEPRWRGNFPPLLQDGSYHVVAGDTRSDRFGITVLPRPAVETVRLGLTPPAYTGRESRTVEDADVDVPEGTRIRFQADTSLPPARGAIRFGGGRTLRLNADPEGRRLSGEFTATDSDSYSVHFETIAYPDGSSFANQDPVTYRLNVREDRPPEVRVLAPPDRAEFARSETVPVVYSAADDYGVRRVRLRYTTNGMFRPPIEVTEHDARDVERATYDWPLEDMPLQPGQVVTYYLEVEDNRPDTPNKSRSEPRRIVIEGGAPPEEPPQEPPADEQPEPEEEPAGEERASEERQSEREREERESAEDAEAEEPAERGEAGAESGRQPGEEARPPRQEPPEDETGDESAQQQDSGESEGEQQDDGEKNAFEEFADYVRSLNEAMGRNEPGRPDRQRSEGARSGEDGTPAEGGRQGRAGEGRPGEQTQSPGQAPEGGERPETPGEGPDDGGQPTGGAAGSGAAGQSQSGGQPGQDGAGSGEKAEGGRSGAAGQAAEAGAEEGQRDGESAGQAGSGGGGSGQPGGEQEGRAAQAGSGASGGSSAGDGAEAEGEAGEGRSGQRSGASGEGEGPAGDAPPGSGGGAAGSGARRIPAPGQLGEGPIQSWEDLDRAVEELERRLEEGDIPPRAFEEFGTNRENLREFIEDYRRRRERMAAGEDPEAARFEEEAGRVIRGGRAESGVRVQDVRPEEGEEDELPARFEGGAEELSPRYRDIVNQYYKALSEDQ